jgi:ketosteroid isomerase-like protein
LLAYAGRDAPSLAKWDFGQCIPPYLGVALEWAININLRKVLMSDTSQIALIQKLYGAMGDVKTFKSLLADDVEWDIAEGFPNGGVYHGINGVFDFFAFVADFDKFYAKGDEYFESGDHVIVLGRYFGVTKKGRSVEARFAHFWTIRDGKIGRLQQTGDSLLIAQALGK